MLRHHAAIDPATTPAPPNGPDYPISTYCRPDVYVWVAGNKSRWLPIGTKTIDCEGCRAGIVAAILRGAANKGVDVYALTDAELAQGIPINTCDGPGAMPT